MANIIKVLLARRKSNKTECFRLGSATSWLIFLSFAQFSLEFIHQRWMHNDSNWPFTAIRGWINCECKTTLISSYKFSWKILTNLCVLIFLRKVFQKMWGQNFRFRTVFRFFVPTILENPKLSTYIFWNTSLKTKKNIIIKSRPCPLSHLTIF